MLMAAKGLCKSFGGVRAVDTISFSIREGTVFAVIGPNGAGKSTLLNLLSGFYQPDSGSINFDGIELSGMPAHLRARHGVARTFQKIRLFKKLTALDNILAGFHTRHALRPYHYLLRGKAYDNDHKSRHEDAIALLDFVGLGHRETVLAGALSYGEQRLLELARALATRPRLLMIDEPAAGLNGAEVAALLTRIASLQSRGITIVLVEHNMELIMAIADRVLVMDYGKLLFEGTPAEVRSNVSVVAAYLGSDTL
jgi:branched-chain amino acid transport system ATP-binding protein